MLYRIKELLRQLTTDSGLHKLISMQVASLARGRREDGDSLVPAKVEHIVTRTVARLGLLGFTAALTTASAVLSVGVAWLFDSLIDLPNHILVFLALVIPTLVTLPLTYLTAISIHGLRRARARSRDLAEAAERERGYLHSAVNNMPIGLVLFDASKRLIVCNDQYRTMYGLPHAVTTRGTHLRQMLEHRLQSGNFEGSSREEYIERILKFVERTDTDVRIVELGDGRTVSIIHHPIATGGWTGTHEDVTERQKLNALLETRNIHLDAALNNMVQGVAMFDR
jgi:PAS domain-containing protein